MDKAHRRQRRKADQARRTNARARKAAAALAASGAIAAGTQAYASPIRFDNPAHGEAGHLHVPMADWEDDFWFNPQIDLESQTGSIQSGQVIAFQSVYGYYNAGRLIATGTPMDMFLHQAGHVVQLAPGTILDSTFNVGHQWSNKVYGSYQGTDFIPLDTSFYIGLRMRMSGETPPHFTMVGWK